MKNIDTEHNSEKSAERQSDENKESIDTNETKNSEEQSWFIYINDNVQGPYNVEELQKLTNEAVINVMTPIYKKGESEWKYIYNEEELKNTLFDTQINDRYKNFPMQMNNTYIMGNDEQNKILQESENAMYYDAQEIEEVNINKEAMELSPEELEKQRKREKKKRYLKRKKTKIEEGLIDPKIKNSAVYITGLPKDVTKKEIHEVFKKAGIIKIDAETTEPKIKIYRDEQNNVKGDALVTYVYKQSVDIAIKYFDNFYFRQDCVIHVEKAQFNNKKRTVEMSKEEIMIKKKRIMAAKYEQMRLQKWGEDTLTRNKKKVIIFRNVFSFDEARKYDEGDPFYDFIKKIIETAISKYTSKVKVFPIPKHPNGIVCVKCKGEEEAEMLITCFNDMILNDNKIEVYAYDGKQDLKSQCLAPQINNTTEKKNNDNQNENRNHKNNENKPFASIIEDTSAKAFNEWLENQSEDEEHQIMVE